MIHIAHFLALLGLSPLLYLQSKRLWNEPHFQFFPLLIGFGLCLLLHKVRFAVVDTRRRFVGQLVSLGGFLIGAFSIYVLSPMFAHISFMVLLCGWAMQTLSHLRWTRILAICSVMMICVPPPANLDKVLITRLQSVSSEVCEGALDALFVPSLQRGNIIEMVEKKLFVDEACSGIDSLYALAAVAAGMLVLTNTSLVPSLLTVTTVPCWAIFGNLCRLIVITLSIHFLNIDLSDGIPHQVLGLVVFLMVSCCHFSTAYMFSHLVKPIRHIKPDSADECNKGYSANSIIQLYDKLVSWPNTIHSSGKAVTPPSNFGLFSRLLTISSAVLAGLLVVGGFLTIFVLQSGNDFAASTGMEVSKEQAEAMLNAEDVGMFFQPMDDIAKPEFFTETRTRASEWGIHSRGWRFQSGNRSCLISLDMPFHGWHDLSACYSGTGWTIHATEFVNLMSQSDRIPYQRCLMTSPTGEYGAIWFWDFDAMGRVEKNSPLLISRLSGNLFSRLFGNSADGATQMTRFQVQLLVVSESPFERDDLKTFEEIFEKMYETIRYRVTPVLLQISR